MYSLSDTIIACSSPPGRGAISIIRISGGDLTELFKKIGIKKIGNKHLITHVINTAKASKIFDKIIVSTDSKKIAKVAKNFGADVPFLRKKIFSGDMVTTESTLKNALLEYESFYNTKFDICVFLSILFDNCSTLVLSISKPTTSKYFDNS